ncbi:alpha/beta fold hydrolase [Nocardia neocaledoniensis]|uniref:alpha/beta fold hydrolase n=1 Tax=Nocardia neocaledoniensis TaxID=236511 RepID=UPI002455EC38|nr:alpha/beta hydrolase [Nocardia neocaledoniensis]
MNSYTPVHVAEDLRFQGGSDRFTYRRIGPRGGVPLLLLHRFRAAIDWWDPEFLDLLAAERNVILFDNIGIGYTGDEALTSVEGFAAGAIDVIEALGLTEVDLLGWSFGGVVAQAVALTRPDLTRKLIVAGSGSGLAPTMPTISERVLGIMAKPDADLDDMLYMFYPETEEARKLGLEHFEKASAAMPTNAPVVSEAAAMGQLQAITAALATPWEQVIARLSTVRQPVLYANGSRDVMIHAFASFAAVEHLPSAKLVLYSDAGHAFLFQYLEDFSAELKSFLAD